VGARPTTPQISNADFHRLHINLRMNLKWGTVLIQTYLRMLLLQCPRIIQVLSMKPLTGLQLPHVTDWLNPNPNLLYHPYASKVQDQMCPWGLKSVPRDEILSAFVGRLHPDTTEEELTKYLSSEGMKGIVCRKLVAKNGRKFNTAAFRVTCSRRVAIYFIMKNRGHAGLNSEIGFTTQND